jgi:hypothetical protein
MMPPTRTALLSKLRPTIPRSTKSEILTFGDVAEKTGNGRLSTVDRKARTEGARAIQHTLVSLFLLPLTQLSSRLAHCPFDLYL